MVIQGKGLHLLADAPSYDGPLEFTIIGHIPEGWEVLCRLNGRMSRGAKLTTDTVYEPRQIAKQVIMLEVRHDNRESLEPLLIETFYAPRATELRPQNVEELIPYYRPEPPFAGGDDSRGSRIGLFAFYAMEQPRQLQVNNDGITIAGSLIPGMKHGTEEPTNYYDMTSPVDINQGTDPITNKFEYVTIMNKAVTEEDQYVDFFNGKIFTTATSTITVQIAEESVSIINIPVGAPAGLDLENTTKETYVLPTVPMDQTEYPSTDQRKDCVTYATATRDLMICRMDRDSIVKDPVDGVYNGTMYITYMPFPYDEETFVNSTLSSTMSLSFMNADFELQCNHDMSVVMLMNGAKGNKFLKNPVTNEYELTHYLHVSYDKGRSWQWTGPPLPKYGVSTLSSRQRYRYKLNEAALYYHETEQRFYMEAPGLKLYSESGAVWEKWVGAYAHDSPRYPSNNDEVRCDFAPYQETFYTFYRDYDSSLGGYRTDCYINMTGDWNDAPILLASAVTPTKVRWSGYAKLHNLLVGLSQKPKEGMGIYYKHGLELYQFTVSNQPLFKVPNEDTRTEKLSLLMPYFIGAQYDNT